MSDILPRENGRGLAATAVTRRRRPAVPNRHTDPTFADPDHADPTPGGPAPTGSPRGAGPAADTTDTAVDDLPGGRFAVDRATPTPPPGTRRFRGRLGPSASSGFHAAPHRYHLYLSGACPASQRLALTVRLLGLGDQVRVTTLPPVPDSPAGFTALRPLYEATEHRHPGPWAAPVLGDEWSGRVVSDHVPHILRDLDRHFPAPARRAVPGPDTASAPAVALYPPALDAPLWALETLIEEDVTGAAQRAGAAPAHHRDGTPLRTLLAALGELDRRLAGGAFLLGETLTGADVHLWVALAWLDLVHRRHLDAAAVHRIAAHRRLWAYARRLHRHPAFRDGLDREQVVRWHRRSCRGPESSGAAVPLPAW